MSTKGEHLMKGLDQLREGLTNISRFSNKQDLIKLLVASPTAARQMKDLLNDNSLLQKLIVSMVSARNSRLSADTVEKVISDFLEVLFDLSQPVIDDKEDSNEPS